MNAIQASYLCNRFLFKRTINVSPVRFIVTLKPSQADYASFYVTLDVAALEVEEMPSQALGHSDVNFDSSFSKSFFTFCSMCASTTNINHFMSLHNIIF